MDQSCPFLHDRDTVLEDRNEILEKRRETFRYKQSPTYRQLIFREILVLNALAGDDEALKAEIEKSGQLEKDLRRDRAYCANMQCLKPWKKGEDNPLKACARCKYTMYCSVSVMESVRIATLTSVLQPRCQKADWPRHKNDPCAPVEEMVENDDIWNPLGFRKGTTFVKSHRDLGTGGFHVDA